MKKTSTFVDDSYIVTYTVTQDDHNSRLDNFLQIHFQSFSREKIKKFISKGFIKILDRNQNLKSSTKVKTNEVVEITTFKKDFPLETFAGVEISEEKLSIISKTDKYIVINKPPFMATHPTGKHLFYVATVELEKMFDQKFHSVHRLDRETSGVMIISSDANFSSKMTRLFEQRAIKKAYFLIGHNNLKTSFPIKAEQELGEIADFKPNFYTHCFPKGSGEGKVSETQFVEVYQSKEFVLSLAFPKTGRQHQIRSHAAHHGFPLLGDKLYNGDINIFKRFKDKQDTLEDIKKMQIPRHALHAIALKIPAPVENMFIAPLPKDLSNWISRELKLDINDLNSQISTLIKEHL